jgi:hypothetical protein
MTMRTMLCTVVCVAGAGFAVGQGARDQGIPGVRPALASVRPWIEAGDGTRSEAEVLARLGPPDRVERLPDRDGPGAVAMTWDESAWIRIVFRGGKARRLDGHFPPHAAETPLTLTTFRKLRPGATRKAIEDILGKATAESAPMKDLQQCEWKRPAELTVAFKQRKAEQPATAVAPGSPAIGVRPALTKDVREWLEAGRGRLSEAADFRKIGLADFVFHPADPDVPGDAAGEIGMIWREQARVDVEFRDGVAARIRGEFAPHARSERITLDNLRKLNVGMTDDRVEEILGQPDDEAQPARGVRRHSWVARQEIVVYFRAGKVKAVTWWGPF